MNYRIPNTVKQVMAQSFNTRLLVNLNGNRNHGFSLLEMAVVMVIVGLLLGGLLVPLATQQDIKRRDETNNRLQEAKEALLGYAILNCEMPCPANANGIVNEPCAGASQHGFVPKNPLGLNGPSDGNNRLLDSWLGPIRYSVVSTYNNPGVSLPMPNAGFRVCRANACNNPDIIAQNLVAVLVATGEDNQIPAGSADQAENLDGDNDFVFRTEDATFDDHVVWISQSELAITLAGPCNF